MTEELIRSIDSALASLESLKTLLESFAGSQAENATGQNASPKSFELTIDDVRKVLADVARESVQARESVKMLLKKYGADKLSDVKQSDYASLKADGERILAERLDEQCSMADLAMLQSEMANLESEGLGNRVFDVISQFTEDGDGNLSKVPSESYPALMKSFVALREEVE